MSAIPKLAAPILPQSNNGVLDKSTLQGQDIKVIIPIVPPSDFEIGDTITVYFTHGSNSITSSLPVNSIPDKNFEIDFPENIVPSQDYDVTYTVDDSSDNTAYSNSYSVKVIDGTSTQPPVKPSTDVPFFVIGARSTLYSTANALYGPQRLTAWDKDNKPAEVYWAYVGKTKTDTSWQKIPSHHFYDVAPHLPLIASLGTHKVTLNPLNIFGNGGISDSLYSTQPTSPRNEALPFGLPEYFSSSFAALLDNKGLVTWGNMNSRNLGLVASNVKKVAASGIGYVALGEDGSLSFWGVPNDIGLSVPSGNDYVDVGIGSTCLIALRSNGYYAVSGFNEGVGVTNYLGATDSVLLFGNDTGVFGFNTDTAEATWWVSSYAGGQPYWPLNSQGSNYVHPRAIVPANNGAIFIGQNGSAEFWPPPLVPARMPAGNRGPLVANNVIQAVYSIDWSGFGTGAACLDNSEQIYLDSSGIISTGVADMSGNRQTLILRYNDGSVDAFGKDHRIVPPELRSKNNVVQVTCTSQAYAALHQDGTVTVWGDPNYGGAIDYSVSSQLYNVRAIYATGKAFAALTSDNRVVTWGENIGGGNSDSVQGLLNGNISYYA
ncbi:RCC1 domain-containing protein [Xenorhabdus sp. PB62.4]|uniref:RCC1 domain-containing protein n=1 Tax=Xenorhabdus sp. PB62.4 TaxID=1851573 RepID=UPI001656CA07|nr:RCC1 domain-containing protein [Xenorhabdus sp. PB62.4]MBC8953256.1 hypothetical protein [Xenorhabdus sp. PB62.4]